MHQERSEPLVGVDGGGAEAAIQEIPQDRKCNRRRRCQLVDKWGGRRRGYNNDNSKDTEKRCQEEERQEEQKMRWVRKIDMRRKMRDCYVNVFLFYQGRRRTWTVTREFLDRRSTVRWRLPRLQSSERSLDSRRCLLLLLLHRQHLPLRQLRLNSIPMATTLYSQMRSRRRNSSARHSTEQWSWKSQIFIPSCPLRISGKDCNSREFRKRRRNRLRGSCTSCPRWRRSTCWTEASRRHSWSSAWRRLRTWPT